MIRRRWLGYNKILSSAVTLTIDIDGKQIESCDSTIIFAQDNLSADVDFVSQNEIVSQKADSLREYIFFFDISIFSLFSSSFNKIFLI